jgi:hypothetical protein
VSLLLTVNTPWLMLAASAIRRTLPGRDAHLLLIAKADNPGLGPVFDTLTAAGGFTSRATFASTVLGERLGTHLVGLDRLVPGRAAHIVHDAGDQLVAHLERTGATSLLLGNTHHAPERLLAAAARGRGVPVGFVEEGLSIYQASPYWEATGPRRWLMEGYLRYQGVREYYGPPRRTFDEAWLSRPEAYPHNDARQRIPLSAAGAALRDACAAVVAHPAVAPVLAALAPESALLLSQRLSEDGLMGARAEIDLLADAARALLDSNRFVYFKPHPRDTADKFAALRRLVASERLLRLECPQVPVEVFLASWRPSAVVGFLTATLVYAPLFFDIPAYTLIDGAVADPSTRLSRFAAVARRCAIPRFRAGHPAGRAGGSGGVARVMATPATNA